MLLLSSIKNVKGTCYSACRVFRFSCVPKGDIGRATGLSILKKWVRFPLGILNAPIGELVKPSHSQCGDSGFESRWEYAKSRLGLPFVQDLGAGAVGPPSKTPLLRGVSSVRLEHCFCTAGVDGSNPSHSTKFLVRF